MTDIATVDDLMAELSANGGNADVVLATRALADATGIASEWCGQDLTALDPIPGTVHRVVLSMAAAIYHAMGRDPAIVQEDVEGVGGSRFGTATFADLLPLLAPWCKPCFA
ncbi:hypothetical protein HLH26_04695 [Gluconacetobacter sp. 1b LMG 1731]|uniref:Phage gp6-like head-tail connector protein n=1 Tax=Gluconacetobacter dulcium TaxID=2729096 RepID=A0A7W4NRT9_9PROT|nr:hypothetical protein [Gluconacetobacter dulcium]MBB2163842.1 hypothetical protein [Gluconacetobacter dulcium]MBB2193168.1 hypothetical protein [Gluconacetobacter dulcium]